MSGRAFRVILVGLLGLFALTACGPALAMPAVTAGSPPTGGVPLALPTATPTPTAVPIATLRATTAPPAIRAPIVPTPTRDTRPDPSQHTIAVLGPPPSIATMPPVTPTVSAGTSPLPIAPPVFGCAPTLQACIAALVGSYQALGVAGVVVTEGGGDPVVAVNADDIFATASLYKLFVLWGVQRAIAAGDLDDTTLLTFTEEDDDSEDDGYLPWSYGDQVTVAEARELMITASNNSASWLLARTIGWGEIDQLIQANGFPHSSTVAGMSTPTEIAAFFDGIVTRTLDRHLRASDYATMLQLLRGQLINSYLSPGFPPGADFAHKTGNLPGIINDAGILFLPGGRVVTIVAMTEGDEEASFALLYEVAAAVWAYYDR
ncbi:MAG: serine hydrolase [Thermomicrobiales bacterium]